MSYPYKASCMADIFPLSYRQPKNKKNFIKENIKKLKEVQSKQSVTGSKVSVCSDHKKTTLFKTAIKCSSEFGHPSTESHRRPLVEKQKLIKNAELLIERTRSDFNCPKTLPSSTIKSYSDKECQTPDMERLSIDIHDESVYSSARSVGLQTDILGEAQASGDVKRDQIKTKSKKKMAAGDKSGKDTLRRGNKVPTHSSSKQEVPESYQRGTVPRYMREEKLKKEQEETQRKKLAQMLGTDDPDCPPGHVLLSEEKRKESLRQIKDKYDKFILELNGLPVRSDSYRIKKHRMYLEKELEKMEAGLKLFSRGKLFVKIGS